MLSNKYCRQCKLVTRYQWTKRSPSKSTPSPTHNVPNNKQWIQLVTCIHCNNSPATQSEGQNPSQDIQTLSLTDKSDYIWQISFFVDTSLRILHTGYYSIALPSQKTTRYRPISILSALTKCLEKIFHQQIYIFLEKKYVLFYLTFGSDFDLITD